MFSLRVVTFEKSPMLYSTVRHYFEVVARIDQVVASIDLVVASTDLVVTLYLPYFWRVLGLTAVPRESHFK